MRAAPLDRVEQKYEFGTVEGLDYFTAGHVSEVTSPEGVHRIELRVIGGGASFFARVDDAVKDAIRRGYAVRAVTSPTVGFRTAGQ